MKKLRGSLKFPILIIIIMTLSIAAIIIGSNFAVAYANPLEVEDDSGPDGHSWTEKADKTIYGIDANVRYDGKDTVEELLKAKKPGLIEGYLVDLLNSLGDGLYKVLDGIGITMDNVIYGRVGGHTKNGINVFRFELQQGNPYGIVGAAIYSVITSICIVLIIVTTLSKFSIAMYSSGSGKKREAFKSSISVSIISLAAMVVMPYFLDLMLYIADIILSAVSNEGAYRLFYTLDGFDIVQSFSSLAHTQRSILNSCIYLSTILLCLYLGFLYIGYAMSMTVLFISFPMICVGMNFTKNLLSQWVKQVVSILIVPIMDCILMMIPVYFGILPRAGSMAIVRIFVCFMIVPSRNVLRQLLGLGSTGLELTAVATMMGAAKLASAAGKAVNQYRKGRKAAKADEQMADYYQDLADNEKYGASGGSNGSENVGGSFGGNITGNVSPSSAGGAVSTGSVSYMGNIAEKHANWENFENSAFKGQLSNQRMAELYRERAAHKRKEATLRAAGAIAGGGIGVGGSMFMSPAAAGYLGAGGMALGGAAGEMVSDHINLPSRTTYVGRGSEGGEVKPEIYSGTVDENTSMVGMSNFSSDIRADNTDAFTQDFCRRNYYTASHVASGIYSSYSSNEGEKLQKIYENVKSRSMGSQVDLRTEFKNEAREKMLDDFKEKMKEANIQYTANHKANEAGMNIFNNIFENSLKDDSRGMLSDNFLNTYDWMSKNA